MNPQERLGRRGINHVWLLTIVSITATIAFFVCTTWVSPRPYYIYPPGQDLERDYYYNGRLLHAGLKHLYPGTDHPGTPIYYLAYLILFISGAESEQAQHFFNIAYVVLALSAAASLGVFINLSLKGIPLGVATLALAAIAAWPSFPTYLNYFGSTPFATLLAVPTLALFWSSLETREANRLRLAICGIGVGAGLATKASFVPVAIALAAAGICRVFRSRRFGGTNLASLTIMALAATASFLALTTPIFTRLPELFLRLGAFGFSVPRFEERSFLLMKTNPLLAMLILIVTGVAVLLLGISVWKRGSVNGGKPEDVSDGRSSEGFDFISAGILLFFLAAGFGVMMLHRSDTDLAPFALRNVGPSALFVPFLILYCYRFGARGGEATWIRRRGLEIAAGTVALSITTWAVVAELHQRQEFITHQKTRIAQTKERFAVLTRAGTRVAFDDDDWALLGEEAFHFGGNHTNANDHFDALLLEKYPGYTFLRLREARSAYGKRGELEPRAARGGGRGFEGFRSFGSASYRWWRRVFPPPATEVFTEMVAGERSGVRVSLIAFTENDVDPELLGLVRDRLGPPRAWKESIAGVSWVLIEVADRGADGGL
jgi:hypothetical protein